MKEVAISRLSEIKSVFNSNTDNEQFYNRLKNAGCYKIDNVELARPIIRQSNATIIWKSDCNLPLIPFNKLSDDTQAKISFKLSSFFDSFKEKIETFSNIPSSFSDQVIEIPDKSSILVNEENDYVVIINWGFLEDSFDRKEGILYHLFNYDSLSSILVKLVNRKNNPIREIDLKLESKEDRETSITDEKGFARFGTLQKGTKFS